MRAIASVWVGTLRCTRMFEDKDAITAHAVNSLMKSICQLKDQEDGITKELGELTMQIKSKRSLGMKALKPLLLKSKQKRVKLTQIVKKRESFEHHLDLLNNNELDQTLISTVKQTANAMKSLGLHKQVDDIDTVMADLEDTQLDIKEVTDIMSTRLMREEDFDDADLEEELNMLMEIDPSDDSSARQYLVKEPPVSIRKAPVMTSSMEERREPRGEEDNMELPAVPV